MKPISYTYPAQLVKITDGDSAAFKVFLAKVIDYGFYLEEESNEKAMTLKFRLLGIDSPEKNVDYEGWLAAKEHLTELLGDGEVILETLKDPGSFGRWLCTIYKDGVNINNKMVEDGFARVYLR